MVTFIETPLFTRLVQEYLSDDEYRAIQNRLLDDPQAGSVIPGSGGVRKLRWKSLSQGKRSGYRVIYFVKREQDVVWMLTMYPKEVKDDIPAHILRRIRKEVESGYN